jgi:hypothetical protein
MFPVHWFLANRSVRARAQGAAIHEPWLVQELTELAGHIAADPIDRAAVLERLAGIIRRITGNQPGVQNTENPT